MRISGKLPRWGLLTLLLIFGVILIVAGHHPPFWPPVFEIVGEIGIAVAVAAILAFTIDRWLHSDLARDAFYASIGHILPPEFRDEIARLITHGLICEKHILHIQIQDIGSDTTRVTWTAERTLKNITARSQEVSNSVAVDEWHSPGGKSEILECRMITNGETLEGKASVVSSGVPAVASETEKRILKPGKTVQMHVKAVEYHRYSDAISFVFRTPTNNPAISVQADTFGYSVNFGPAEPDIDNEAYSARQSLRGTYFPQQHMRIRWWKKPVESDSGTRTAG